MPVETSKDFKGAARRLLGMLRRERARVAFVVSLGVLSTLMMVLGPKVLGDATDVVVRGAFSPDGVDFGRLHRTLLLAGALYALSAGLAYLLSFMPPASCNARCPRCEPTWRTSSTGSRSATSTATSAATS